jgi:molybdopterin/thiamine biosynthesis adenylyltransferase
MPKSFDTQRYLRQTSLSGIGIIGQEKLLSSKVLVIGAGGLGSPILLYLAAAGIGKIGLVEYDVVSLSNLQRQVLYSTNQIGKLKSTCASQRMMDINPDLEIKTYTTKICGTNALEIIKDYDVVLSAVDNIKARYAINLACVNCGVFLIDGAICSFEGQIMNIFPGKSACYQCIYPESETKNDVQISGPIGTLPGIIGVLQANEAIKYILKIGTLLKNQLLYYNALSLNFRKINIKKNPMCSVCSKISIIH